MALEIKEVDLPILIEPSQLFCKALRMRCKYLTLYGDICEIKGMSVKTKDYKSPDWCPLKWDALFNRK